MELRTVIEVGTILLGVCGTLLATIWRMINGRLKAIDTRVQNIEDKIEGRIDIMAEKLSHVETNYIDRFTQMYQQLHETEANIMTKMDNKFTTIDGKIDDIKDMIHAFANTVMRKDECKSLMEASEKI